MVQTQGSVWSTDMVLFDTVPGNGVWGSCFVGWVSPPDPKLFQVVHV
jgi:hypothetical protein